MPIEARCPSCDGTVSYEPAQRGTTVACPWRQKTLRIPGPRAEVPASAQAAPPPAPGRAKSPALRVSCPSCGAQLPEGRKICAQCGLSYRAAKHERDFGGSVAPSKVALNGGVIGGLALIAIAGVWFYFGWKAGYIYFYPIGLALVGVLGIIQGVSDKSWRGGTKRPSRPRRRESGETRRRARRR